MENVSLKKFLIPLLIFSSQFCSSQVYHLFPDSDAKWSEEALWTFPWGSETIQDHCGITISLGSDTIFNSKKYSLLLYKNIWSYETADGILTTIENDSSDGSETIIGAIREDSDKKIWLIYFSQYIPFCTYIFMDVYLPNAIDSEILLYDFDLHIGDVVDMGAGERSVTDIDSTQLQDGSFRKEFIMTDQGGNPPEHWIEGIGSTLGFFGPYINYGSWLNCFSQNGQTLFEKSNIDTGVTCDSLDIHLILDVPPEKASSFISPIIYPNPFTNFTTIQFNLTTPSETTIEVFNLNGMLIKTLLNNQQLNSGLHSVIFYGENNPSGIYYFILRNDANIEVGKMVLAR